MMNSIENLSQLVLTNDNNDVNNILESANGSHLSDSSQKKTYVHNRILVTESYFEYLIKANSRDRGKDKWIYDILNGSSEADRIVYRDKNFIMFPPKKTDNDDLSKFHMLSFVTDKSIRSLRDLTDDHINLLRYIYSKSVEILFEKYGIQENKLRTYIHYHPTTWLLHMHFNLLTNKDIVSSVEYSYSVHDVIQNLIVNGNHYRLVTMKIFAPDETMPTQ